MSLANRKILLGLVFLLGLVGATVTLSSPNYLNNADARLLIDQLVQEEDLDELYLEEIFSSARRKDSVLKLMRRPAEKTKPWYQYREIFVTPKRIREGLLFYKKNERILEKAEEEFGVPAEIIISILGVETFYGRNTGSYRVIDALSTLAFNYPTELKNFLRRKSFFMQELKHYLIMTYKQGLDPLLLKGSYAGAMGLGQFMPSSYRAYAVDFDDDSRIDIWRNVDDAVGSVANYLSQHGWREGENIVVRADFSGNPREDWINAGLKPERTAGDFADMGFVARDFIPRSFATAMAFDGRTGTEYWMGFQNFYVITRYNHSAMYALSVFQLAQEIKKGLMSDILDAIPKPDPILEQGNFSPHVVNGIAYIENK